MNENKKTTSENCPDEIDVTMGAGVVYLLLIVMLGTGIMCLDLLYKAGIREWLSERLLAVIGCLVFGYLLFTVYVHRRWRNRCKKEL